MQSNKRLADELRRIDSIQVYLDVRMQSNVATHDGIVYAMRLGQHTTETTNWERSKKLMFGSLVCLSSDNFEKNCIVGTVCERDIKTLKSTGQIYIRFSQDEKRMTQLSTAAVDGAEDTSGDPDGLGLLASATEQSENSNTNSRGIWFDENLPKLTENYIMIETSAFFEVFFNKLTSACQAELTESELNNSSITK